MKDTPLIQPEAEYFTDRRRYVRDRLRYASYAVVTVKTTIEPWAPQEPSAQKAELIALNRALQLAAGLQVTFIHCHGDLWKERDLINSSGRAIKYKRKILKLLNAVWAPKQWQSCIARLTRREAC